MTRRAGLTEVTILIPADLEGDIARLALAERVTNNHVIEAALRHFVVRQTRHAAGVAESLEGLAA